MCGPVPGSPSGAGLPQPPPNWRNDPERHATDDLERAVRRSDVISTATMATEPLIRGAWLRPGQHLDLIGGYRPDMREADDECVARAGSSSTAVEPLPTSATSRTRSSPASLDRIVADFRDLASGRVQPGDSGRDHHLQERRRSASRPDGGPPFRAARLRLIRTKTVTSPTRCHLWSDQDLNGYERWACHGSHGQTQGRTRRHHRVDRRLPLDAGLALSALPERDQERRRADRPRGPGGGVRLSRRDRRQVPARATTS